MQLCASEPVPFSHRFKSFVPDAYSVNFPNDEKKTKTLGRLSLAELWHHPNRNIVYVVFALDILQTVFATHCAWGMLVHGWGDPNILIHPPWSSFTFPIMTGISEFVG
jgi:hypothetical protein